MSKLEVYIKDPDIADPDKKVKTMQSDVVYMCGMTRDEEGGCKMQQPLFRKRSLAIYRIRSDRRQHCECFPRSKSGDLLLEFQMLYNVYNTIDTRFDKILTLLKEKKEKKIMANEVATVNKFEIVTGYENMDAELLEELRTKWRTWMR